jgi:hypothetical protein
MRLGALWHSEINSPVTGLSSHGHYRQRARRVGDDPRVLHRPQRSGTVAHMNLERYILDGGLADEDPQTVAVAYINTVLDLPSRDEQVSSLETLVRPYASRVSSKIRRAQRSGSAQSPNDSQTGNGGPAHDSYDSHQDHGGPVQNGNDIQRSHGGPAWARENAALIGYCRDHQSDHYWVPGAGRRKLIEITRDEWLARARWLTQQSQGALKSAAFSRGFANLIDAAGVATVADVLEVAVA